MVVEVAVVVANRKRSKGCARHNEIGIHECRFCESHTRSYWRQ